MRYLRATTALLLLAAATAAATETEHWITDRTEEFLQGRGDGVAVTETGRLERVERWQLGVGFSEPLLVGAVPLEDGSVLVGTGHPARLYRVRGDRKELLTDVPGDQVTALLATGNGDVLVAAVTPGVLYRWHDGRLDEVARLGEGGIWDLAEFAGSVVAAAGPPATLYRLTAKGLERWLELPDSYARCLATTEKRLLVGTAEKGLILGVEASGAIGLVADSPFTEISDLLLTPSGDIWATALVGEPPQKSKPAKEGDEESAEATVTVSGGTSSNLDLPKVDGNTAASELLRVTPEGGLLSVHRFAKQVATTLAWDGEGVVVGTGYEGEVWRFLDSGGARLTTVDAVQVVAVARGAGALLTQAPSQLLWRRPSSERPATYRIDARQYPQPVRFGAYSVSPADEDVKIRFRSGASEKPDDSWLPWTDWLPAGGGRIPLPAGRSLQWEVQLTGDATVERVDVATREVNLAPRVAHVTVHPPGVIYLAGPPPSGPVIELEHPDVSGIFTVIDEHGSNEQARNAKGKKYWRVGFRTVSWDAADPNGDPLRFTLEAERADGFRLPVRDHIDATQLAVDASALPDGEYRFLLTASDGETNPGDALSARGESDWFTVDSTPPQVHLARAGDTWTVTVQDALSPVTEARWSRDGGPWHQMASVDGVLDQPRETFTFPAETGRHLVVVMVIDSHHNRATAGVVEGEPGAKTFP